MDWPVFAYVDDVERVDDYTVRFNMDNPSTLVQRLIMTTSPVDSATYGELAAEARAVIDSGATSEDEAWTAMRTKISDFHPEHALFSGPYQFELSDVGDAQMTLHWQPNSIY
jgi:peptide/nickel transport system substrate-binding protein